LKIAKLKIAKLKICAGFTLVETALYVAITSILLLGITAFYTITLESRVRNQVVTEVDEQGAFVLRLITQTATNALSIDAPSSGAASSLTLTMPVSGDSPTELGLGGGAIYVREGAGSDINLTSSRVIASNLSFRNLTPAGSPGVIRISFTLEHVNPAVRREYDYAQTFYGTASLRQ